MAKIEGSRLVFGALHTWSLSIVPRNLDAQLDALADLDPTRLVVIRTPGKQRQKVQFFAETRREAECLQKKYGGEVAEVTDAWQKTAAPHPPIRIRDRFLLVETPSESADEREIIIPAGLAFGTGDHPTTASCLRLLCDVAACLSGKKWTMLDVGTGSGVLAIAAKKLGAQRVGGFDYDKLAIRTAKENAGLNAVRGIRWSQEDLQTFSATDVYDVVAANIFSELFLGTWERIRPAVAPGGYFILSGILRFQAADCRAALESSGLCLIREVRLGKWATFLAQDASKRVG